MHPHIVLSGVQVLCVYVYKIQSYIIIYIQVHLKAPKYFKLFPQ